MNAKAAGQSTATCQAMHDDSEMRRRWEDASTYTTPILITEDVGSACDGGVPSGSSILAAQKEARDYLRSFDVMARTDDIIQILQQEEAVRRQFEELVPLHVSYEQFWARFFFRCDADRIIGCRLCETAEKTMSNESSSVTSDVATTTRTAWSLPNPLDIVIGKFDASAEASFRRGLEDVYTTPLLCELPLDENDADDSNDWELLYEMEATRDFLATFDIDEKTEEIAAILENDADDPVRTFFESLVPVDVAYGEFWARYFYRCDESRIARAWIALENHLQEERRRTISAVKSTVVKVSRGVIVNPTRSVLTTGLRLGSIVVNTALLPVEAIVGATSVIVNSAGRLASSKSDKQNSLSALESVDSQGKARAKLLQRKLVETKRKLRQSEADASRLRNQLLKAHDGLQGCHSTNDAIQKKSPTAIISFAETPRRPTTTLVVEDNTTSSSAITEGSFLANNDDDTDDDNDDEWSVNTNDGKVEMDSTETSLTAALDESLSSAWSVFRFVLESD